MTATLRQPATLCAMLRLPGPRIHASWSDGLEGELHGQPGAPDGEGGAGTGGPRRGGTTGSLTARCGDLRVRIYGSGSRAFTLDYRHAGRQRRMTLGRWPDWSATAARERGQGAAPRDRRREVIRWERRSSGREAPGSRI